VSKDVTGGITWVDPSVVSARLVVFDPVADVVQRSAQYTAYVIIMSLVVAL
jgi:hypothetical protein